MKRIFGFLMAVIVALSFTLAFAGLVVTPEHAKAVKDAHALKDAGKYEEAAKVHPQSLCRAVYLLNAAAQVISQEGENGQDSEGNYLYNNVTAKTKVQAEALLDQVAVELKTPDEWGCDGTSKAKVEAWLKNMTKYLKDYKL